MLYQVSRVLLFILIFAVLIFVFKKLKLAKIKRIIAIVIAVVLLGFIWILPFENLFVSFQSPEAAFRYAEIGDVIETVSSAESSVILYKRNANTYSLFFATKKSSGYQLTSFFQYKRVSLKAAEGISVSVYQVKNTADYYVFIFGITTEPLEISDNRGTQFRLLYSPVSANSNNLTVHCLSSINYDAEYCLDINGTEVFR